MGGSWSTIGGSHDISWFTEVDRAASVDRVKAVVVRVHPERAAPTVPVWRTLGRAAVALWRIASWKVLPRRSVRRVQQRLLQQQTTGWSGSVGPDGPEQVRYSRERAVVSTGGREFSLPGDDRALLVLIDARAPSGDPIIETHVVPAPSVPREQSAASRAGK